MCDTNLTFIQQQQLPISASKSSYTRAYLFQKLHIMDCTDSVYQHQLTEKAADVVGVT